MIFPIKILVFPSGRDVSTGGRHFSSLEIEGRGEIEEESLCASVVIPVCKSRCRMSEATFFFLGLHHDEMAPPGKKD